MRDLFNREIKSMRISLTQRCNLNCFYCHREGQEKSKDELSAEEIQKIVQIGSTLDIKKLKITGGEPLLRDDILEIVKNSAYLEEVSMTTNGVLLDGYAGKLRDAGLDRVNVSLDSLNPRKYKLITGKNYLSKVISGVKAAVENELKPVKLNMVLMKNLNHDEIDEMIKFCGEKNLILQLIEMETGREWMNRSFYKKYHHNLLSIEKKLRKKALRIDVREMHHRRKYFLPFNGGVQVEVVRPMHNTEFCRYCTRIRVTSNGKIKPCLFDNRSIDIGKMIRAGEDDDMLREIFKKAIRNRKPYWI